ncbi:MAG: hypothetical protein RL318_2945 [Fibrobacterota bacterium]|jgi:hypothetical protein
MDLLTNPDKIRLKLSMLWIFVVANYLYCDVLSLMDPTFQRALLQGGPPGLPMTEGFLLGAGILMEIPMAMIVVSRLLAHRSNRWLNFGAGIFMALVQIGSFWMGTGPTLHYIFFSAIEILTTATIAWTAWKWIPSGAAPRGDSDTVGSPTAFPARLLLTGAILLGAVIPSRASGWETKTSKDGSTTVQSKVSSLKTADGEEVPLIEYKAITTAKASFTKCVAVLLDVSNHKLIHDDESSRIVETVSDHEWIVHYGMKVPWPLPQSDCVTSMTYAQDRSGLLATFSFHATPTRWKTTGAKRMNQYDVTYTLRDLGAGRVEVSSTGRVSPPFKVPQWMLKAALPGSVSDPLKNIVKLAGN